MKKLKQELRFRLFSFLAWLVMHIIGRTCGFRVTGFEHVRGLIGEGKGFILAVWHGRTLLPVYYNRGMGIWAITSLSKDGEYQTRIISRFGYRIIRGSSRGGGIKAALTACKKLREGGILAITPDGPLGPPNEVQEGIVFLAEHAECPIIPIGAGARRRKILPVWDSYALPMPFAKCALVFGEPIYIHDSAASRESARETIKTALDGVQRQAELEAKEGQ